MEIIGIIGAVCFSVCAVPAAVEAYRRKSAVYFNSGMLWLWLVGELCMIIYVPLHLGWDWPLMANYLINLACLTVIFRYKIWPKTLKKESSSE